MKWRNIFIYLLVICMFFSIKVNAAGEENEKKHYYTALVNLDGGFIGNDKTYEIYGLKGDTFILQVPEKQGFVLTGYTCDHGEIQPYGKDSYIYTFSDSDDMITASWRTDSIDSTTEPHKTEIPVKTEKPEENNVVSILKMTANNSKIKFSSKKNYKIYLRKNAVFYFKGKNISNLKYQVVKKGKQIGKWKTVWDYKVVVNKKNCWNILYIKYKDASGSYIIKKTKGFYIDKSAPVIKGIKNNAVYRKNVSIIYQDKQSGIKSAKLNGRSIKSGTVVSKNGNYKVVAVDKAGNKKITSFCIMTPKPTKRPVQTKPQQTKAPKKTEKPKPTTKPKNTAVPKATAKPGNTVQAIKLSQSSVTLSVGQSITLKATVLPENVKNKGIVWKSTQPFVASVSESGKIVACSKGRTTIIAVSKANSKITKSCTVLVK